MAGRKRAGTAATAAMAYSKETPAPTKMATGSKAEPKLGKGQSKKKMC